MMKQCSNCQRLMEEETDLCLTCQCLTEEGKKKSKLFQDIIDTPNWDNNVDEETGKYYEVTGMLYQRLCWMEESEALEGKEDEECETFDTIDMLKKLMEIIGADKNIERIIKES